MALPSAESLFRYRSVAIGVLDRNRVYRNYNEIIDFVINSGINKTRALIHIGIQRLFDNDYMYSCNGLFDNDDNVEYCLFLI